MMTQPKVSICIPTYNQAEYLRFSVQSALAQKFDNLDIVISDNHSSDGTLKYLSTLTDERVHVVRPPQHLPMADHWRFCVSQSTGDYFNLLSSDDVLLHQYVSKLAALLCKYPTAAFAYCAAQIIDEHGKFSGTERHVGGDFFRRGEDELNRFIRGAGCVFTSMLIRRDHYERVGGFKSWTIVGDWELELRLIQVGDVVYHDEELIQYRSWTTVERGTRLVQQIQEIAQVYDTTVEELLDYHPAKVKRLAKLARKSQAFHYAMGIGRLIGKPEFEEAASAVLGIHDSVWVHLLLQLHRYGLSEPISAGLRTKNWLRQKIKALLNLAWRRG